jgi:hypothetical protein
LHVVVAVAEFTILSNFAPQLRHRYSKIGIPILPIPVYRKPIRHSTGPGERSERPREAAVAAAFLVALLEVGSSKMA